MKQTRENRNEFVWKQIQSVDEFDLDVDIVLPFCKE